MAKVVEEELCELLGEVLHGRKPNRKPENMEKAAALAEKHSVLPLLYEAETDGTFFGDVPYLYDSIKRKSIQTVQQSYHLLFLSRYVIQLLAESGITAILLKGCSAAAYYPVPELRKSGDIDILLKDEAAVQAACACLQTHGFLCEEVQHANHHVVCVGPNSISVELHITLTEAFDDSRINQWLTECRAIFFEHRCSVEIMGVVLPVLQKPYLAFHLLLHMLQHFLRAGFGLKLLCDWVVFWEQGCTKAEQEEFLELIQKCGISGFCSMITRVCIQYLALSEEKVSFMQDCYGWEAKEADLRELLDEICEAEEFGKASQERMVALRGEKPADFLREFHHQTLLTYPKAERYFLLLPFFWIRMLVGFLYRNYHLRKVSTISIFQKAAKRGALVRKMHIFKR